jgi:hypothetical protein
MLTPEVRTRRTDDIEIVHWPTSDDGTEMYGYVLSQLDASWEVRLQQWRTVSANKLDGSAGFSVDRASYLAKDSDGRFFSLNEQMLKLLFN